MPLHPYIVPLPIAVFTDAAPARLGWRVAFLGGRCGAGEFVSFPYAAPTAPA